MSDTEYYKITLEVVGVAKVNGRLLRSSAPLTIQAMHKKMQEKFIAGRAHWVDFTTKDAFYFEIGIQRGREGNPTSLKKGEMGYSFKLDSIFVALSDDPEIPYEVVKVGEIMDNVDVLGGLTNGKSVKMKLE